jgi:hypothetical protein
MISIGYTCQRLSFLMTLMFLSVYKSHDAVPFLDFQKNEENLKRLHCWIPLFKMRILMFKRYTVTLLGFEKNEENLI